MRVYGIGETGTSERMNFPNSPDVDAPGLIRPEEHGQLTLAENNGERDVR